MELLRFGVGPLGDEPACWTFCLASSPHGSNVHIRLRADPNSCGRVSLPKLRSFAAPGRRGACRYPKLFSTQMLYTLYLIANFSFKRDLRRLGTPDGLRAHPEAPKRSWSVLGALEGILRRGWNSLGNPNRTSSELSTI